MSNYLLLYKDIESLSSSQLVDALEFNGYRECIAPIRSRNIDGNQFLKLTEVQISLWRLPITQSRRLWSFIQLIKSDPRQLILNLHAGNTKPNSQNVKPKLIKSANIVESSKGSSLTKLESVTLKSRLEEMFQKDIDDMPNPSFIHQQRNPQLPPKPKHLKQLTIPKDEIVLPVEEDEDYLSPIQIEPRPEDTFLSKYRRESMKIDKDWEIVQDTPKLAITKRPLPPLPPQQNPANEIDKDIGDFGRVPTPTSEEEMPEYTPIEEEILVANPIKRALPPIPIEPQLHTHTFGLEASNTLPYRRVPLPEPYQSNIGTFKKQTSFQSINKPEPPFAGNVNVVKPTLISNKLEVTQLPRPPPPELPILPTALFSTKDIVTNKVNDLHIEEESSDEYDSVGDELKHVPCYRETDRKGARMLLTGLEDGAFIIRPSRKDKYLCTISIMHTTKMFNIGVEKNSDGTLTFGNVNEDMDLPTFYTIHDIINYFSRNPIPLYGEYVMLKNVLPPNKR